MLRAALYHYADMPRLVDNHEDALHRFYGVRLAGAIAIASARGKMLEYERTGGWGFWQIVVTVGGVLVSLGAGFVVGYLVAQVDR